MAKQFWIHRRGEIRGPLSPQEVVKLAENGQLDPNDLISADNENWTAAREIKGLFGKSTQPAAPQSPAAGNKAPTRKVSVRPSRRAPAATQAASATTGGASAAPFIIIGVSVAVALLVVIAALVVWSGNDEPETPSGPGASRHPWRRASGRESGSDDSALPADWRPPAAPDWGREPKHWSLPQGVEANYHFEVIPGRRWVFFTDRQAEQFREGRASGVRYHYSSWVLDTVSGETTAAQDFVKDTPVQGDTAVIHLLPSPDGCYALMQTAVPDGSGRPSSSEIHLVTLHDRACHEYTGAGIPRWAGPRMASMRMDSDQWHPIVLQEPFGGEPRELGVRGHLADASDDGNVLLCRAFTDGNFELWSWDAERNEKLGSLALENVSDMAVSPNGQFMAVGCDTESGPMVLVTDASLNKLRELSAAGVEAGPGGSILPVAVLDDGAVIARGRRLFEVEQGAPVVMWSAEGNRATLANGATAAGVADGRLFYATAGEDPAIHSIPLPEAIEETTEGNEEGEMSASHPPAQAVDMPPEALRYAPPGAVFAAHLDWPAAKDSFMGSSESPVRMPSNAYQAVGIMGDTYLDDDDIRHPCLESIDFFVASGPRSGWLAVVHGRYSFYMSREFLRYCFNREANLIEQTKGYYSIDIGRENDVVVALGREAEDVPEDIILIGPSSLVRPGLFETLGPAREPSLLEAMKNVDTSADAWAVGRIPPGILPIAADHIEAEVDLDGQGESSARIGFSENDRTEDIHRAFTDWLGNLRDDTYEDLNTEVTEEGTLSIRGRLAPDALLKLTVALWPKPDVNAARERSRENLQEIHNALARYLEDHGEYPRYLGALAKQDYLKPSRLMSPMSGEGAIILGSQGQIIFGGGYVYLYTRMPPQGRGAQLLRVYENPEYYDNEGTLVLLADGTVQWMGIDSFNTLLRQTRGIIGPAE
ncbi:MAG: GYF domain-containing protein [Phycisphaerae bacterium]